MLCAMNDEHAMNAAARRRLPLCDARTRSGGACKRPAGSVRITLGSARAAITPAQHLPGVRPPRASRLSPSFAQPRTSESFNGTAVGGGFANQTAIADDVDVQAF
jgi:hypothetical protein